jgi:formylglycine-generating enzyme required for sulfatase activity
MPSGQTSLSFVTVGDPGNAGEQSGLMHGDTNYYGSVGYIYQMGQYDVTLAQYTMFLNAVAASDPYGLYKPEMAPGVGFFGTFGIGRIGNSGSYSYSVVGTAPNANNIPVSYIDYGDAARFCNWLQNGQPTGAEGNGTTETGAYTLSGGTSSAAMMLVTRNAGAKYFIPSEDEWFKAAFYKGGGTNAGYWTYATQSDVAPNNSLALAATNANDADYFAGTLTDPTNYLTPVGTFAASPSAYGTFDQIGDLYQWNEANVLGTARGLRGGSWGGDSGTIPSSYRIGVDPDSGDANIGFRVATIPEPSSLLLLISIGALGVLGGRWRRVRTSTGVCDIAPTILSFPPLGTVTAVKRRAA